MCVSSEDGGGAGRDLVVVVDESEGHRRQVTRALLSFHRVVGFSEAAVALDFLRASPACAVMVDRLVAPSGGEDLVRRIKADPALASMPVIFTDLGDEARVRRAAHACGADACLTKPYRRSLLIRLVSHQVNKVVERRWASLPTLQRSALIETMAVFHGISDGVDNGEPIAYARIVEACAPLVEAVELGQHKDILNSVREHDDYSYAHSLGTATLLLLFGHTIGLKEPDLSLLGTGGLLHDVGKMRIPFEVLNKPGALDAEERAQVRSHVPLTLDYLRQTSEVPRNLLVIAAQHHERLDGSGYPDGLKGRDLNELARMASIVDVFCALSERRVYRESLDAESALYLMTHEMQAALDQNLLILFREMLLDTGRQGPIHP